MSSSYVMSQEVDDTCNIDPNLLDALETDDENKKRMRSHWMVHMSVFTVCIGFSIVVTGSFPYLKSIQNNPNLDKNLSGYVVAAGPVGQMIASPILGFIETRIKSVRSLFYITSIFFCVGNFLYGSIPLLDNLSNNSSFHYVLVARLLVGIGAGSLSIGRSYLAESSTQAERTAVLSMMSVMMSLGYVLGPTIQMALNLTINDGLMKYQAGGFLVAVLGVMTFIWMSPCFFQEVNIAARQRKRYGMTHNNSTELPQEDRPAMFALLLTCYIFQLIYVFMETILEPLVQDQYGWCDDLAVFITGMAMTLSGGILILGYTCTPKLSKIMDERLVLLIVAFGLSTSGMFLFIPWGHNPLPYCPNNKTRTYTHSFIDSLPKYIHMSNSNLSSPDLPQLFTRFCTNDEDCYGCPSQQSWCLTVPKLPLFQLLCAFVLIEAGYPFGIAIGSSIYSKIIGPRPQGIWMGIVTSVGAFSRITGPLFVSHVYSSVGTQYTFGSVVLLMVFGFIVVLRFYKRLIPLELNGTS